MKKVLGCFGWLMVIIVGIALLILAAPLALAISVFAWWYFNKKGNEKYVTAAKLSTVISALGTVFFIYAINNPTEPEIATTPVEQSSSLEQVDKQPEETEIEAEETQAVSEAETEAESVEGISEQSEKEAAKNEVEEESKSGKVPREHQNALDSAQNYIDVMHFSEAGLYNQLTSEYGEQYPAEAAQYAIENVEVDYNEEALQAAESYQEIMPMSDDGLYQQLTSEHGDKFTAEQAQYAIDNLD